MTEQERQAVVQQLVDEERTRCEIWFRLKGYTKTVASYNPGKRQEHADRLAFKEPI